MIPAVHNQQRDKRHQGRRPYPLSAPADGGRRREHLVDRQFRPHRLLVLLRVVEHIVRVEAVGQLVAHEVTEQQAARRLWHVRMDQRQPERLAGAQPRRHDGRAVAEIRRVALDQLDRRHHLAMPPSLEESDVFGIGVEDVHVHEVDVAVRRAFP